MAKTKKKTAASQIQDVYEQQAQAVEQADKQYLENIDAANREHNSALNAAQQLYQQRINEGYTQFADIVAGERKQMEDVEKESLAQQQAQQRAAKWTGATELAASLANLIAVGGYNAVNQNYHSYSQDWMQRAEENMKRNRARIDNLRDRQRVIQQRLLQMKMGDAGQALELATKQADNDYQRSIAAAQARLSSARDAQGVRMQGKIAGIEAEAKERERKEAAAQQAARINLQYDLHGWNTDPKTGRRVAPASSGSDTKGGSSTITISIAPEKEGGKGTRMKINSGSLLGTINANLDLFKADDQSAIERIIRSDKSADDKAKQLQQYIKSSPEILDLLKLSSLAVDEFDWGKSETKAGQAAETPSQRSQGSVGSAADLDKFIGG